MMRFPAGFSGNRGFRESLLLWGLIGLPLLAPAQITVASVPGTPLQAVPLYNPSFESHNPFLLSGSGTTWNNGPIIGWDSSDPDFAGEQQPGPLYLTPLDGLVTVWADSAVISQNLTTTLTPGNTYVLTVGVGRPLVETNYGYAVRLMAGTTILAEDLHSEPLPYGWQMSRVVYVSSPGDPNAGLPLRIELESFGEETDFDAVSLFGGPGISDGTFDTGPGNWVLSGGCQPARWDGSFGNPPGSIRLSSCGESASDPTASQTFGGLTPGTTYTVSADVHLYQNSGGANGKSFGVFVDREPGNPIYLGEFLDGNWHSVQATFTATASAHTIFFAAELDSRTPGVQSAGDVSYYIDNVTVFTAGGPDLAVATSHDGSLFGGQTGAQYTITVANSGTAPTLGQVSVVDSLPTGVVATAIGGAGWTCTPGNVTCVRSDSLAAGAIYPAITLTVNIASNAPAVLTNTASVAGGGDINMLNNVASDTVSISQVPDLAVTMTHLGSSGDGTTFLAGGAGSYSVAVLNAGGVPTSGQVTVSVSVPPGITAVSMTNGGSSGWSCTLTSLTCSRSDSLAALASYSPINVTVAVGGNAASSSSASATVSGGGEANTGNDVSVDTVAVLQADLTISLSRPGVFTQGQTGAAYTIAVNNGGTAPTVGTVTVTDTLPAGLTASSLGGTGWSCILATLTCTRADGLAAGSTYPLIVLLVNVSLTPPASVTDSVTVAGGLERNTANDSATDTALIASLPPGSLTIAPDKSVYSLGQTVTMSGKVLSAGGYPVNAAQIVVDLIGGAAQHSLSATSALDGTFSVSYQPVASEAGAFTVSATAAAGGASVSAASLFRILGLQVNGTAAFDLVMGTSSTIPLTILNTGTTALNAVSLSLANSNPGSFSGKLTLTGVPSSLSAGASAAFTIAATAAPGNPPASPVLLTVTAAAVDSTSGVTATETALVTLTLRPATSSVVLSPPLATLGVNPGSTSVQQYTVRNDGYIAIPAGTITLQSPPSWISLGQSSLGQILPGGSATFQMIASPPAGLAAGTFVVPFSVNGGTTPVLGSLTVNVSGNTTGTAAFSVADDIGLHVAGATVTLISKADSTSTFPASTDSAGNVTLNGVPSGDYYYVVAAPNHDPGAGSVRVSPGGGAQALAVRPGVHPMLASASSTPVYVVLNFNVVTLTFSVTSTTITDVYNTQLVFTYAPPSPKPVLQVIPSAVNCAFYPSGVFQSCVQLTITNLHPVTTVTDVTVDASKLDSLTAIGQQFQGRVCAAGYAPSDDRCASRVEVGDLAGSSTGGINSKIVTIYGKVFAPSISSRNLGTISVSGTYQYVDINGNTASSTTSTPVPASYTYPTDLSCDPIRLIHDPSVASDDLRLLDPSFVHTCTDGRPGATATFVTTPAPVFNGSELVAFAQTNTTAPLSPPSKSDFNDIRANTPFWRTNFAAGASLSSLKAGFTGSGDIAYYGLSQTGNACGAELIACLRQLLYHPTAGNAIATTTPLWLGFGTNWSDRNYTDGYKIPITIYQPGGAVSGGYTGGGGSGGGGGDGDNSSTVTQICTGCGASVVSINVTQALERQAFKATLGIAPNVPLENVQPTLVIEDSAGADASGQFTVAVTLDRASGNTVSSAEQVRWQLIPKAGAGGVSGLQYTVSAILNFTLLGVAYSPSTNPVTITVFPQPHLQVTYSLPYIAVPNKQTYVGITVQNTGGGPAHNFTASSAQPVIQSSPDRLPVGFSITGSSTTPDGSTFQQGNTQINFGDIASGAIAAGYFALNVTQRGYVVKATADLIEHDYLGAALDPLVGVPTVVRVPALGGTVSATGGTPNGLVVSVSPATAPSTVVGSDTTDQAGAWFIPNLSPGSYVVSVKTAAGTPLASPQTVTIVSGVSTDFMDFMATLPTTGPVAISVGTSQAGLSFSVDGVSYTTPQTFTWAAGSPHTLFTTVTQPTTAGTRYVFGSWSNGGLSSQTVTTPTSPTTYTAGFSAQYLLTTAASPVAGGVINTNPTWYNAGTVISIIASANVGYQFASFSGDISGSLSPASITMNGPKSVTANFSPMAPVLTASISTRSGSAASARSWTLTLTNNGIGVGLGTRINNLSIVPVGSPGCTVVPRITLPSTPVSSASPLVIGDIGPVASTTASGSATIVIDFSGCQTLSKFTVNLGFTANSGSYAGSATFNNQFR